MSHNIYKNEQTKTIDKKMSWTEQQKNINKIRVTADLLNEMDTLIALGKLSKEQYAYKHLYANIKNEYLTRKFHNKIAYDILSEVMGTKRGFVNSKNIKIKDLQEIAQVVNKILELWNEENKKTIR